MKCLASGFEGGDDFFVDQLLDFSNAVQEEEDQLEQTSHNDIILQDGKSNLSVSPEDHTAPDKALLSSRQQDFGSLPHTELSIPMMEGLESLEWLSQFVEDSFSHYPLTGKLPLKETRRRPSPEISPQEQQRPCFITPVQTKSRTKRARTGVRIWPVLSPSFIAAGAESSTSSSSSTSTSTKSFQHPSNPLTSGCDSAVATMTKKAKPAAEGRRCSHCSVTKTPQWRAGPQGSKSLCNACGVRYKSGRLLPEYRPACSPSFSIELHSNNHRKVLEMRRKKEAGGDNETLAGRGRRGDEVVVEELIV